MAWVPGRLLLEAARSPTTMHVLLDGPLRMGVFPAKMSIESQARQWAAVWLAAGQHERRAVKALLRSRATMQAAIRCILQARSEGGRGDHEHDNKDVKVTFNLNVPALADACYLLFVSMCGRGAGSHTICLQSIFGLAKRGAAQQTSAAQGQTRFSWAGDNGSRR